MAPIAPRVAWTMLAGVALSAASFTPAVAFPLQSGLVPAPQITLVEQGCGPGWWRGPWGHCRDTPYTGNVPGGGYGTDIGRPYVYEGGGTVGSIGCPPGYWRGPWNECRAPRTAAGPPAEGAGK